MDLPLAFCWTRFGVEAGQTVNTIFARKELERKANRGLFLWGVGNAIGTGLRVLLRETLRPCVAFSPIRSNPKAIDVHPERVFTWTQAKGIDGVPWPLPSGALVMSRADSERRGQKTKHYALVCKSTSPLSAEVPLASLHFDALRNLASDRPLGASQVTAVVREDRNYEPGGSTSYDVVLVAELAYPYFVELTDPVFVSSAELERIFTDTAIRRLTPSRWEELCAELRARPTISGHARPSSTGQIPLFASGRSGTKVFS